MPIDFSTDKTKEQCIEKENHITKLLEDVYIFFKEKHTDAKIVDYNTPVAVAFDTKKKCQVFRAGEPRFVGKEETTVPNEVGPWHMFLFYAFNSEKMRGDDRSIVPKLLKLNTEEYMYFEYGLFDEPIHFTPIDGTPSYFCKVAQKCREIIRKSS